MNPLSGEDCLQKMLVGRLFCSNDINIENHFLKNILKLFVTHIYTCINIYVFLYICVYIFIYALSILPVRVL